MMSNKNNNHIPDGCSSGEIKYIMPAEWDSCMGAVMIAWPHDKTDWAPILDEVEECYCSMSAALVQAGMMLLVITPDPNHVRNKLSDVPAECMTIFKVETNDTWTRDYGPITVRQILESNGTDVRFKAVDFGFNGWGLKFAADKDNLVNLQLSQNGIIKANRVGKLDFILEGGSVESDGCGLILTTSRCLLSPNRNGEISRNEVQTIFRTTLGAEKVLWLDYGSLAGDDTDSHIDTLARLAPGHTILYVKSYRPEDQHTPELEKMERQLKSFTTIDGQPFNLIGLPLPDPIFDDDGERLPATYANFLITPHYVIMPTYAQPANDLLAEQMLKVAFPDHDILKVDCRALIRQHGSLHCATMQMPKEFLQH